MFLEGYSVMIGVTVRVVMNCAHFYFSKKLHVIDGQLVAAFA